MAHYPERLEKILYRDCVGSGGAFYDVDRSYYPPKIECCFALNDNRCVYKYKHQRIFCAYENFKFDKPSDIDKLIYQMLIKASKYSFGKLSKLTKDGYINGKSIIDIYNQINGEFNGYILVYNSLVADNIVRKIKPRCHIDSLYSFIDKRTLLSRVIPDNICIFTGNPADVGLMNGPFDVDDWMYRNFFVVPGRVFAFKL